jgi:PncC family amidohydrolase
MTDNRLEAQVGIALRLRGWTVCAAESCTGGLVLHRLTNIPGSSDYVLGGVVAYSYEAKSALLGVPQATLSQYGAVSAETAEAMVRGVLTRFGASVAISITGIAGPGGGMPDKPVGLTYIALATSAGDLRIERSIWSGDRESIKSQSADAALRLMLTVAQNA